MTNQNEFANRGYEIVERVWFDGGVGGYKAGVCQGLATTPV